VYEDGSMNRFIRALWWIRHTGKVHYLADLEYSHTTMDDMLGCEYAVQHLRCRLCGREFVNLLI
jgi:hypothetical protein